MLPTKVWGDDTCCGKAWKDEVHFRVAKEFNTGLVLQK